MTRRDIFKLLASIPGVSLVSEAAESITPVDTSTIPSNANPVFRIRAESFSYGPAPVEERSRPLYREFPHDTNFFSLVGMPLSPNAPMEGETCQFLLELGDSLMTKHVFMGKVLHLGVWPGLNSLGVAIVGVIHQ